MDAVPPQPEVPAGFTVRCLRSLEELEGPWLDLVAAVFGPLGAPRQYFARHWTSDTDESQDLSAVLVAVEDATGAMVSTVRVFRRALRTRANGALGVGGVGEVSTLPAFRGRGLARALLAAALGRMAERGLCGALHAAAGALSMYRSLGFWEVAAPFHVVALCEGSAARQDQDGRVEPLDFDDDGAWHTFERSEQSWERWVRQPAEALDEHGLPKEGLLRGFELVPEGGGVAAYLIVKVGQAVSAVVEHTTGAGAQRPLLAVLDFASAAPVGSGASEAALLRLLGCARAEVAGGAPGAAPTASVPRLLAPGACAGAPRDASQGTWMYRGVGGKAELVVEPEAHLVMPLDEF